MKIGPGLFAVVLLGVSAMHPSPADGAPVGTGTGDAKIDGARPHATPHRLVPRTSHIERNAIGLATERHERPPERDLVPSGLPRPAPQAPGPAAGDANHIVTSAVPKVADNPVRASIVSVSPAPPVAPIVANHGTVNGTINGTGLVRPSHAPAVIGGPAKAVASINGTTIRLRH
jgi:hypothetical protein